METEAQSDQVTCSRFQSKKTADLNPEWLAGYLSHQTWSDGGSGRYGVAEEYDEQRAAFWPPPPASCCSLLRLYVTELALGLTTFYLTTELSS